MRTIWKYNIDVRDEAAEFYIPKGGKVVHIDCIQPRTITFWVELDNENEEKFRQFQVIGTGHPVPSGGKYIGTVIDDIFVWHLYGFQEE